MMEEVSTLCDALGCTICGGLLMNPHSLPCKHHFCALCIQQYVSQPPQALLCPQCQHPFWNKDISQNFQLENIANAVGNLLKAYQLIEPNQLELQKEEANLQRKISNRHEGRDSTSQNRDSANVDSMPSHAGERLEFDPLSLQDSFTNEYVPEIVQEATIPDTQDMRNFEIRTNAMIEQVKQQQAAHEANLLSQSSVITIGSGSQSSPSTDSKQKIVIAFTALGREKKPKVYAFLLAEIEDVVFVSGSYEDGSVLSDRVTHLVSGCNNFGRTRRTLKFFEAILRNTWVVRYEWLVVSADSGFWHPEQKYEVDGDICCTASLQPLYRRRQLPKLFAGMSFCFVGKFQPNSPSPKSMSCLIRLGGGQVVKMGDRKGDTLFVGPPDVTLQEISIPQGCTDRVVNIVWIMDSIVCCEKQSLRGYVIPDSGSSEQ